MLDLMFSNINSFGVTAKEAGDALSALATAASSVKVPSQPETEEEKLDITRELTQ